MGAGLYVAPGIRQASPVMRQAWTGWMNPAPAIRTRAQRGRFGWRSSRPTLKPTRGTYVRDPYRLEIPRSPRPDGSGRWLTWSLPEEESIGQVALRTAPEALLVVGLMVMIGEQLQGLARMAQDWSQFNRSQSLPAATPAGSLVPGIPYFGSRSATGVTECRATFTSMQIDGDGIVQEIERDVLKLLAPNDPVPVLMYGAELYGPDAMPTGFYKNLYWTWPIQQGQLTNKELAYGSAWSFMRLYIKNARVELQPLTGTGQASPFPPGVMTADGRIPTSAKAIKAAGMIDSDPKPQPPSPTPAYLPKTAPAAVPDAETLPLPGTRPTPVTPALPGTVTQPSPATPGTAPETTPQTPPLPLPWWPATQTRGLRPVQSPWQVGNDGRAQTEPDTKVDPTDKDSHFINGKEIKGKGARPDLVSIARELARVEDKVAKIMTHGPEGNGIDWIDRLLDLLPYMQQLIDALIPDVEGYTWEVAAPCDKDADKNPLIVSYELPSEEYMPAAIRRLDAIMDMMKQTIAWRRPVCKGAVTNNVTITAYGIDNPDTSQDA